MTKKAKKEDDKKNPNHLDHVETHGDLPEHRQSVITQNAGEQTARWARENLEALINSTEDLIWSLDLQFRILSANNSFKKTIKQATGRDIHVGDSIFSFEIPENAKKLWTRYYQRGFDGEVLQFVDLIQFQKLEPYFAETKLSPIRNGKEVVGVACISSNIQERLENQKNTAMHNKQLMELIGIASHEIRGPITSILGLINLFNLKDHSDPFNAEIIPLIERTAKQLDQLIHQFVDKTYALQQEYQIKSSFPRNQSESESL